MARKRMIDPSFWVDEKLGTCTRDERLLFMGLISNADDAGRLQGHPALLKSIIFPYDFDINPDDVEKLSQSLHQKQLIQIYQLNGQTYIAIYNFLKHQTIKKPTPSKLPAPPELAVLESSGEEVPQQFPTSSEPVAPKRKEEKRKEEKGSKGKESREPVPHQKDASHEEINNDNKPDLFQILENSLKRNLSGKEIEIIRTWYEDLDPETVNYAFELACMQNKISVAYIDEIIFNWLQKGIKTFEQAVAHEEAFKTNKRNRQDNSHQREPTPRTLTDDERKMAELIREIEEEGG